MASKTRNETQPTYEDLELLAEISSLLTLTDGEKVPERIVERAAQAVGAQHASLFLYDEASASWGQLFTTRPLPHERARHTLTQLIKDGFAGWVWRNKAGDIVADTHNDARWKMLEGDTLKTGSALCVPCIDKGTVIALIALTHDKPHYFTPAHLRLMGIIATQTVIAIRNAALVQRLRAQSSQLATILHAIQDALLVFDDAGHIMLTNDAALHLLDERSQQAVIGQSIATYARLDQAFEPIKEIMAAQLPGNTAWSFETRSDRLSKDYQVTMGLWRDELQDTVGYVILMHDVTMLRDLHRFKDEMLHVATHDLRSPLALISGYADMITLDTPDPTSPVHEYVTIMKTSIERMGNLIEDMLRVERIRSSPLELREQTDLEHLVKVVLVNMRPSAEAKHQRFRSHLQLEGLPQIEADTVLIRQAMENVIANAIKYTPDGGEVTVRAHYADGRFNFSVQDNGIGIPEEHLPYLFESFYRVQHISNKQKGSGLGLSLVKNVIARHQGDVWVKSKLGEGSRFGFWLPVPPADDPPANVVQA